MMPENKNSKVQFLKGTFSRKKLLRLLFSMIDFLKEGTLYVQAIFLIAKIRSLSAANFCPCRSIDSWPQFIYLPLLKISRIFPPCARYQTLSVKNPRDYNSYAVHQLDFAGRREQGAVR
jgi:hypothetical protein